MIEFEAQGPDVYQKPHKTATGTTMGFRVLTIDENLGDPDAVARVLALVMSQDSRFCDQ